MIFKKPSSNLQAILKLSRIASLFYNKLQIVKSNKGYIDYYKNIYNPEYSGWQRFVAAISFINKITQEKDTKFIVLIYPLLTDVFEEGRYPFEFAHKAIHALLDDKNIPYIDTLERFRKTSPYRMMAIPIIDPHPSEIAHRIVAEALFDFLFDIDLLSCEYELRWRETEKTLPELWRTAAEQMGVEIKLDQ